MPLRYNSCMRRPGGLGATESVPLRQALLAILATALLTPAAAHAATITPNGDGFRDRAELHFTLSEPATVTLQVQATRREARTIYKEAVGMRAGPQTLAWAPGPNIPARTYLLHLTATDPAGNEQDYG